MSNIMVFPGSSLPNKWVGYSSDNQRKRSKREHKIEELLSAVFIGDIDHARLSFSALLYVAPELAGDLRFSKLGAALQSSNMALAQVFGREIKSCRERNPKPRV